MLSIANACGGNDEEAVTTTGETTVATRPAPVEATFEAKLVAPSHAPLVNKPWHIVVTVEDKAGKPLSATLRMNVLFAGRIVGRVDEGKIYRINGRHEQDITWPPASIGYALTFQAVVKADGATRKLEWRVKVRR